MVGIPRMNENSVAATREVPINNATMIVAADRDVPGNTPAKTCATPMANATLHEMESATAASRIFHSASRISNPPPTTAPMITHGSDSSNRNPAFRANNPKPTVNANATPHFAA